jgi:hypothetical protein
MKFRIEVWTISKLLEFYESGNLNLNPSYQRNDIWPPISKKRLIESVELGYPLPSFFLHEKGDGKFDIIDGQQRTRTFIGYKKKYFADLKKKYFTSDDVLKFNSFQISVIIISKETNDTGSIEDFYFRVNKYGIKLNRPEIKRSEFPNSIAQNLVEKLADNDDFIRLGLFTEKSTDRLNDLDFVSELLSLIKYEVTEKKSGADKLYKDLTDENEAEKLEERFCLILNRISELNESHLLSKSRYRQRNDFYTFFHFLLRNSDGISQEFLKYQYQLLILIGDDIFPTNEKCWPFQDYANNCVSQSNSKKAREERLQFFEKLLLNKSKVGEIQSNEFLNDIIDYYNLADPKLIHVYNEYYLINVFSLSKIKNQQLFAFPS